MHDTTTAPAGADRRGFLTRAGMVTALAAAATTARTTSADAAEPALDTSATALTGAAAAAGPAMFYVRDAVRGEIGVLVGEREVVYTDKATVLRLLTIAGR